MTILVRLGASAAPKRLDAGVATETMVKLGWDPWHGLLIGLIGLGCILR